MRLLVLTLALVLVACSDEVPEELVPLDKSTLPAVIGGAREAPVHLPANMYEERAYPLVVLLHGYSASGFAQDVYLGTSSLVSEYDYILVIPEGTLEEPPDPETNPNKFWNATEVCCDRYGAGVDDVAYLTGLIDEAIEKLPVDPARVYLFGHSNGGYMSYRMACDVADRITAIASLAGAMFKDPADCNPSEPVSVLQIHGTLDDAVPYEGSDAIPSALESVEFWASHAGCDVASPRVGARLDLDDGLEGDDTDTLYFEKDCAAGIDHALYTIVDGTHLPNSVKSKHLTKSALDFLFRHEK
jgi:polyhydroxybutyrate depolymerase